MVILTFAHLQRTKMSISITMNVETDTFCGPHRVMTRKNRSFCLDSDWTWAKDLLEKFNRPAGETTKMPLNTTLNSTGKAATSAARKHPKIFS